MMDFYSVKPFYFVLIHYLGGPDFELEIFSPFAVEIYYPNRRVGNEEATVPKSGVRKWEEEYDYVEVDKNGANLYFNAVNISHDGYEFVIERNHLQISEEYHVI